MNANYLRNTKLKIKRKKRERQQEPQKEGIMFDTKGIPDQLSKRGTTPLIWSMGGLPIKDTS